MAKKIGKETYIYWYKLMLLLRRFEERAGMLYGQQKIRGFCHLYIGQEAVAAGLVTALRNDDRVITAYRDHALAIAKGISPRAAMAELFGKATGCSKGKGGSMHFFSKEHNFFGGHGIVGAQIALGAGIAFADQYLGKDNVTVCLFGDGAARQGILHETFNMAMMWRLPVVFICENNGYAMGTSVQRSSNVTDLSKLGLAYEMPSESIDGMKCENVHFSIEKAAERARSGNGPTFIEIKTYRYKGHSMSDPQKYRTKEEVEAYKKLDPVETTLQHILKNKWLTEEQVENISKEVDEQVDDAVQFAESSPYPDDSELYKDIYKQEDYPFLRE
ncbi:MAG: pyruvate dehydrogenase (acetyl-transferring) E1 component subunit alpha [Chitinophagales bacterium]|nr:pyruvate dehydrogenase (acetyl-transferring) E1 component subunit alpha [Chitinophagales bacterium]MDW8273024.1 pyruvate dehydrogenase (acetyl-transferring) E1 component subunit alpha [Chitinophagales bacterium]